MDGKFDLIERLIVGGTNIGLERKAGAWHSVGAGQVSGESDTLFPALSLLAVNSTGMILLHVSTVCVRPLVS